MLLNQGIDGHQCLSPRNQQEKILLFLQFLYYRFTEQMTSLQKGAKQSFKSHSQIVSLHVCMLK